MQSIPVSTCRLTVSAMAGVTCAAITAASVISALASRPGMSSQPLGGGSRPTCEVLIRVVLRCIFLFSPVPAGDLQRPATLIELFARRYEGFNPGLHADTAYRLSGGSLSPHRAPLSALDRCPDTSPHRLPSGRRSRGRWHPSA